MSHLDHPESCQHGSEGGIFGNVIRRGTFGNMGNFLRYNFLINIRLCVCS